MKRRRAFPVRTLSILLILLGALVLAPGARIAGQEQQQGEKQQAAQQMRQQVAVAQGRMIIIGPNGAGGFVEGDEPEKEGFDVDAALSEIFDKADNSFTIESAPFESEKLIATLNRAIYLEENQKNWTAALQAYYSIIEGDKDFLTQRGDIDGGRVYVGLKEFCRRRVAHFPAEGVRAFRLSYDSQVKRRLQTALGALNTDDISLISINYPLSEYADEAAWYAAGILFEQAKYNEALFFFRNFIEQFPRTNLPIWEAYARLAACARMLGPSSWWRVADCLKNAPQEILDKQIHVSDGENPGAPKVALREYIEKTEQMLKTGNGGPRYSAVEINPAAFSSLKRLWVVDRLSSNEGYDATVCGNMLYVSLLGPDQSGGPYSEGRIKGYDIETGKQTVTAQKYRLAQNASLPTAMRYMFPSTVSADESTIYFLDIVSTQQRTTRGQTPFTLNTELHACDAATGKIKWSQPWLVQNYGNSDGVPLNEAKDLLQDICLTSAPVRNGAYLYATGVVIGDQSTDFFLLCFDAETGILKWYRYVGFDATMGLQNVNGYNSSGRMLPVFGSRVVIVNNTVFFSSNMGVVGSANAINGDIKWLARYAKPLISSTRGDDYGSSNSSSFIWYETPIKIVFDQLVPAQGGQAKVNALYVAPRDSDRLYALDSETGARIWERPFADSVPIEGGANDYRWIAFSDNLAVIAQNTSPDRGGGAPSPVPDDSNGQYYTPRNIVLIDLSTGKEIDFHGHVPLNEGIGGRPVIIGRYIFVITKRSLIAYDSQQGDKIAIIRPFSELTNGDQALEIQIVGDKLLVFCSTRIFCYSLTPEGT